MHVSDWIAHVFMRNQTCFIQNKGFTLCSELPFARVDRRSVSPSQKFKKPHLEALVNLSLHANSHAQQQSASLRSFLRIQV